jgi:hypothetical protein
MRTHNKAATRRHSRKPVIASPRDTAPQAVPSTRQQEMQNGDAASAAYRELDQVSGVIDVLIELCESDNFEQLEARSLENALFAMLGNIERAQELIGGKEARP